MTLVGLLLAFVSLVTGAVYLARAGIQQGNPASSYGEPWNDAELAGFVWNEPEPADTRCIGAIQNVSEQRVDGIESDLRVLSALFSVPNHVIGPDLHTTLALAGNSDHILALQAEALRLSVQNKGAMLSRSGAT